MARTETEAAAEIRELSADDLPDCLALSAEAGWNQTAEDWAMMIRLGRAFGVPGTGGRLVATALALPYPPGFGWVSMVLVHGPCRRRGLGTLLLDRAARELQARGLVPFLDATPAGRPAYERMGFRPLERLTRWQGRGGGVNVDRPPAIPDAAVLAELDRVAFGADRTAVLADLLDRPGALAIVDPGGRGFCLTRRGRTATSVGPLVARETPTALRLLEEMLAVVAGPVLIDAPEHQRAIADLLARRGFTAQRTLTRMALGRETGVGEPLLRRAIAGPELG